MKIEIVNPGLYSEKTFNVRFIKNGELVALALAKKTESGFSFPQLRMIKGHNVQDMKDSKAELLDRVTLQVAAIVDIDSLSINMTDGFLISRGEIF